MKKMLLPALLLFSFALPVYAQDTAQMTCESALEQCILAQNAAPITKEKAIEITKQEGIAKGTPPDWFGDEVDATFDGEEWLVFFSGKPTSEGHYMFGNYFGARVSSDGKNVRFIPGV